MKKILFILLAVFIILGNCVVRADEVTISQQRDAMIGYYLQQSAFRSNPTTQFLDAVYKGDLQAIGKVNDIALFSAKDKWGNNCFHLAQDASTLQALSGALRRIAPGEVNATLTRLRNERNDMGETPLMAHLSYGRTGTFSLLYEGSELQAKIKQVQSVDKGGILTNTAANTYKQEALEISKDKAGRTPAQVAKLNEKQPGMDKVLDFFQNNAPYLF